MSNLSVKILSITLVFTVCSIDTAVPDARLSDVVRVLILANCDSFSQEEASEQIKEYLTALEISDLDNNANDAKICSDNSCRANAGMKFQHHYLQDFGSRLSANVERQLLERLTDRPSQFKSFLFTASGCQRAGPLCA